MKFETLVTRYKNIGYEPLGLDRDSEIASIIKWLYYTYDIYVDAIYCSMRFPQHKKFTGSYIWNSKKDQHVTYFCKNSFIDVYDAKYDAVRHLYAGLKFQLKYSSRL